MTPWLQAAFLCLLATLFYANASDANTLKAGPPMVSLFGTEEAELDRYSAVLAATESLRKKRDDVIKQETSGLSYLWLKVTRGEHYGSWMASPLLSDECRQAQAHYLRQAGRIISGHNLSISRFNQLSKVVAGDGLLKERVTQQSSFYQAVAQLRSESWSDRSCFAPWKREVICMFAKSLKDVEDFRLEQREKLMNAMDCDTLPRVMCADDMSGVAAPAVKRACSYFPRAAERLVESNGFSVQDFNALLARCHSNLAYRYMVLRQVNKFRALSFYPSLSDR
ncbi:unnamed protein product [Chrysoparadoxa australica]